MQSYQLGSTKFNNDTMVMFGVSTDNTPSQKEFATKLGLSFSLLSDFSTRNTAKAYGVLRPDGMCNRVTFVIDEDMKITYVEVGNSAVDASGAETACSRLDHKKATAK